MSATHQTVVRSSAKINLFLQVRGKRPDGFHELYSLFQEISLYDEIRISSREDESIHVTCPGIPQEENLVTRAAEILKPFAGKITGLDIEIEKKIPVGAGLGGGSGNAAFLLSHLNELWECGLDGERLRDAAAQLGSDVPFFLTGGIAIARGRGEDLTPLPSHPLKGPFLIFTPDLRISTARVYGALNCTEGVMEEESADLEHCLRDGGPFSLRNDLYSAALKVYPELEEVKRLLQATRPALSLMTGSGASFWAVYPPPLLDQAIYQLTNRGQISIVMPVR